MGDRAKKRPLQVIVENGQPSAVILDIEEYKEMLERLEDLDDLESLRQMRECTLEFRKLEEFLEEYSAGV